MEFWSELRRRVLTGELTKRAALREYDIHWDTLTKILEHEEPPVNNALKTWRLSVEKCGARDE
jgi:hypothetical protein